MKDYLESKDYFRVHVFPDNYTKEILGVFDSLDEALAVAKQSDFEWVISRTTYFTNLTCAKRE